MKAGRLRHRIRIDVVTSGVDALGAPTKGWSQIAEVNASVDSISGREYLAAGAGRDLGEETWKIIIRRVPGLHLDGTFRATDVDTGAVFDITAVLDSHVRDMMTLVAKSGSSHP
jgi:head-tail adaptor